MGQRFRYVNSDFFSVFDVQIDWFLDNNMLENGGDYNIIKSTVLVTITQYKNKIQVDGWLTNLTVYNSNSLSTKSYTCKISNALRSTEEVSL